MKFKEITTDGGAKVSAVLCGVGSLMDILGTRHGIITLSEIQRAGFEHDREAMKGDFDIAVNHIVPLRSRVKKHAPADRRTKYVENLTAVSKYEEFEKKSPYYDVLLPGEDERVRRL